MVTKISGPLWVVKGFMAGDKGNKLTGNAAVAKLDAAASLPEVVAKLNEIIDLLVEAGIVDEPRRTS